jgi:hypothetical protein
LSLCGKECFISHNLSSWYSGRSIFLETHLLICTDYFVQRGCVMIGGLKCPGLFLEKQGNTCSLTYIVNSRNFQKYYYLILENGSIWWMQWLKSPDIPAVGQEDPVFKADLGYQKQNNICNSCSAHITNSEIQYFEIC